jgi:hypothetical protein
VGSIAKLRNAWLARQGSNFKFPNLALGRWIRNEIGPNPLWRLANWEPDFRSWYEGCGEKCILQSLSRATEAAHQILPNKDIGKIREILGSNAQEVRRPQIWLAERAGFEPAVRHWHLPWRLGGDSRQTKSRPDERLFDFLLLVQHLTWLRGQDLNLRPSGYEPDRLAPALRPQRAIKSASENFAMFPE